MEYLIYNIIYLDISYDFCHHIFQTLDSNIIYGLSRLLPSTFVETIPRLFGENFQIVPEEQFWQNSFVPGMFHDEI